MAGGEVAGAHHHLEALLFGAQVMGSPHQARIHLAGLDGLDDGGRVLQFEDLQVALPVDLGVLEGAAQHGVAGGQAHRGDLLALEVGEAADGAGQLGLDHQGRVLAHDAADDLDVRALGVEQQGRGGAEGAHVQLAGDDGVDAVGGVLEFHQFHLQAFLLEEALFLGDEVLGMAGDGQVAHLEGLGLGAGCSGSHRQGRQQTLGQALEEAGGTGIFHGSSWLDS